MARMGEADPSDGATKSGTVRIFISGNSGNKQVSGNSSNMQVVGNSWDKKANSVIPHGGYA